MIKQFSASFLKQFDHRQNRSLRSCNLIFSEYRLNKTWRSPCNEVKCRGPLPHILCVNTWQSVQKHWRNSNSKVHMPESVTQLYNGWYNYTFYINIVKISTNQLNNLICLRAIKQLQCIVYINDYRCLLQFKKLWSPLKPVILMVL